MSEGAGSLDIHGDALGRIAGGDHLRQHGADQGSTNNGDYSTNISNLAVAFALNQTQATVTLTILNDTVVENDETFAMIVQRNASDPLSTYLAKSTFTIIDNDTLATSYSLTSNAATVG